MARPSDAGGDEAELRKMAALGRLTAGIAHDFNNQLTVIAGFAQLALMDDNPARAGLEQILIAAERASQMSRRLVSFGRPHEPEPEVFDVNNSILDLAKILRRLIGEDIEVVAKVGKGPMTVYADPGDFEQNVMQLAIEAREGMLAGAKLLLSAETRSDGQCGVSVGESTIMLPVHAGQPEMLLVPQLQRVSGGSAKVLAVEDDDIVLQLVCDALSLGGFQVLQSRGGEEALELLHAQGPAGVDLLVTDMVMPGMSGRMLAERAKELLPRLKVLYLSGHADEAIRGYGVSRAEMALLRKPFGPGELLRRVRELLEPALQPAAETARTAE